MTRTLLLTAGAAGLALIGAAPAVAATNATTTASTVTTCSYSGLQSGLSTKVCAEITGNSVALYGQIGLAGPPSPGGPGPQPQQLYTTLSGNVVGGASLGTSQSGVIFKASTTQVRGVSGTVACGSTVHASFAVASFPWANTPVTLDVPVAC